MAIFGESGLIGRPIWWEKVEGSKIRFLNGLLAGGGRGWFAGLARMAAFRHLEFGKTEEEVLQGRVRPLTLSRGNVVGDWP